MAEESQLQQVPPKQPTHVEAQDDEEEVEHSYCWNFFSHFAIPIFIYIGTGLSKLCNFYVRLSKSNIVLYCVLIGRGWKFAFGDNTCIL